MQWVKGSGVATAAGSVTAVAQIQSLAWELPYATSAVLKQNKAKQSEVPVVAQQ